MPSFLVLGTVAAGAADTWRSDGSNEVSDLAAGEYMSGGNGTSCVTGSHFVEHFV